DGEHTAILGPNGSGKSSLIRLITRQYYPLARSDGPPVQIYGRERWGVAELRTLLGVVSPDAHQLALGGMTHGRATGNDVVLSGFFASTALFAHHHVTDAMRQRTSEMLDLVEATYLAGKPIAAMSTGEVRRIFIARALVPDPRALLLDEPTAGLDLLAMHRFLATIRRVAQHGKTIILVTHHVEEIIPEIGRVILLKEGHVFCDGPKAEVLTGPTLSALYDAPIDVRAGEYYQAGVDEKYKWVGRE
ncbi:MAG TPA: ATP-binding cassette domain-containing protein, partial [Ktedonobacterales bacterium]|nr:ATP-binding cassette domain-containing protein [Ktedonobacterales bacterium]